MLNVQGNCLLLVHLLDRVKGCHKWDADVVDGASILNVDNFMQRWIHVKP